MASSIKAVEMELRGMPPPIRVALQVQDDRVSLGLTLDHYHLSMLQVTQVPPHLPSLSISRPQLALFGSQTAGNVPLRVCVSRCQVVKTDEILEMRNMGKQPHLHLA